MASFFTDFLAASCQFRLESEKRIFSYAGSADPPVTDLPRSMTLIEKPGRARLRRHFCVPDVCVSRTSMRRNRGGDGSGAAERDAMRPRT